MPTEEYITNKNYFQTHSINEWIENHKLATEYENEIKKNRKKKKCKIDSSNSQSMVNRIFNVCTVTLDSNFNRNNEVINVMRLRLNRAEREQSKWKDIMEKPLHLMAFELKAFSYTGYFLDQMKAHHLSIFQPVADMHMHSNGEEQKKWLHTRKLTTTWNIFLFSFTIFRNF